MEPLGPLSNDENIEFKKQPLKTLVFPELFMEQARGNRQFQISETSALSTTVRTQSAA